MPRLEIDVTGQKVASQANLKPIEPSAASGGAKVYKMGSGLIWESLRFPKKLSLPGQIAVHRGDCRPKRCKAESCLRMLPLFAAPCARLAWYLRGFVMNPHESFGWSPMGASSPGGTKNLLISSRILRLAPGSTIARC